MKGISDNAHASEIYSERVTDQEESGSQQSNCLPNW